MCSDAVESDTAYLKPANKQHKVRIHYKFREGGSALLTLKPASKTEGEAKQRKHTHGAIKEHTGSWSSPVNKHAQWWSMKKPGCNGDIPPKKHTLGPVFLRWDQCVTFSCFLCSASSVIPPVNLSSASSISFLSTWLDTANLVSCMRRQMVNTCMSCFPYVSYA